MGKIIDPALLAEFSTPGRCALCGRWSPRRDPHHWFVKRWCRRDVRLNLVSLCRPCHNAAESGPRVAEIKAALLVLVARREKMTTEELETELRRLKWGT